MNEHLNISIETIQLLVSWAVCWSICWVAQLLLLDTSIINCKVLYDLNHFSFGFHAFEHLNKLINCMSLSIPVLFCINIWAFEYLIIFNCKSWNTFSHLNFGLQKHFNIWTSQLIYFNLYWMPKRCPKPPTGRRRPHSYVAFGEDLWSSSPGGMQFYLKMVSIKDSNYISRCSSIEDFVNLNSF